MLILCFDAGFWPKTGLICIDIAMLNLIFPFDKPTGGFIINNISINREQDSKIRMGGTIQGGVCRIGYFSQT
jgi:hypothetical protein